MKKLTRRELLFSALLLLSALLFSGCGSYSKLLDNVPGVEFKSFEYDRLGRFSTTTITATDGVKDGNHITVEHLKVVHNNPWFSLTSKLEGWKRQRPEKEKTE